MAETAVEAQILVERVGVLGVDGFSLPYPSAEYVGVWSLWKLADEQY